MISFFIAVALIGHTSSMLRTYPRHDDRYETRDRFWKLEVVITVYLFVSLLLCLLVSLERVR